MALQVPNLSSTFHMADNHQIWQFPQPETRWKFTDMIFEEKRWHGGGTEKGVLTSGASKKRPTPIWKTSATQMYHMNFFLCFFWSPKASSHTDNRIETRHGGDFPYIFP